MGLREQLRRLKREASRGAVLVHQRDGTTRAFDVMTVWKETYLTRMALLRGEARPSDVLDAVRNATPESRRAFEKKFGSLEMQTCIVKDNSDDAWVREYKLREDGTVEESFHAGGSAEARRLLKEAREGCKQTFF